MERVRRLIAEANNDLRTADHLACVAYPLLHDNKILPAIVNKLYKAGLNGISAVLYYEKLNKRINILPLDVSSRMELFESEIAKKMIFGTEFYSVMKDLVLLVRDHRESPIEFSRADKFVICSDNYEIIKTLDILTIKSYLNTIKKFLVNLNNMR